MVTNGSENTVKTSSVGLAKDGRKIADGEATGGREVAHKALAPQQLPGVGFGVVDGAVVLVAIVEVEPDGPPQGGIGAQVVEQQLHLALSSLAVSRRCRRFRPGVPHQRQFDLLLLARTDHHEFEIALACLLVEAADFVAAQ